MKYECNTGLECEDCIGGCEQNLTLHEPTEKEFCIDMLTFIYMVEGDSYESAQSKARQ